MIILKKREKPNLLLLLDALNRRMALTSEQQNKLTTMRKGFEGERLFDAMVLEKLTIDGLLLNDLLLTVNGKTFQIDSLLITDSTVYLFEIKNYKGEYYNRTDYLLSSSGTEITNPLDQLNRTSIAFRQLLKELRSPFEFVASVIYVNSNFTLFDFKKDDRVVLPTQIESYISRLNYQHEYISKKHYSLAERLIEANQTESEFYKKLPSYEFEMLRKGLTCYHCGSFDLIISQRLCQCTRCHEKHPLNETVIHTIKDFKLLFPKSDLTRNKLAEWCGGQINKKRLWKILHANYKRLGSAGASYYI